MQTMSTRRRAAKGAVMSNATEDDHDDDDDDDDSVSPSERARRRLSPLTTRASGMLLLMLVIFALIYALNHPVTFQDDSALSLHADRNRQGQSSRSKSALRNASDKNLTKRDHKALIEDPLRGKISSADVKKSAELPLSGSKDAAVDVLNEPLPSFVEITPLSTELENCHSTIVTGYFQIASKFSASKYDEWMKNFLSIQDCLVIFSSADLMDKMKELRKHAPARTVLIEMEIDALPISRLHATDTEFWQHQLDIDKEKRIHRGFKLFWVWLSKSWCVKQAIEKNFFNSEIFMWQDIGSYRNKIYNGKTIIQHPETIPDKTLLWMAHHPAKAPPDPIWNDKQHQKQFYFHSGSQAVGHKDAWLEYHQVFAETMDIFLARHMFIGEDQCVLQGACQRAPDLCAYVSFKDVKDNHYFGLRYVLSQGGEFNYWRMPGTTV